MNFFEDNTVQGSIQNKQFLASAVASEKKKKWFGTPSQSSFGDRRKQLRKHEQKQE